MRNPESPRHSRLLGLAALLGRVAPCGACVVRVRRERLALSVHQDPASQPAETGSSVGAYLNAAGSSDRALELLTFFRRRPYGVDILPALKGEDSSVGRRTDPTAPGCQLAGSWTLLRPFAQGVVGWVSARSGPSRTAGRGPHARPGSWATGRAIGRSRPSKPHGRDQPGKDCFLSVAATASRRPRRRPCGNGVIAFVVRAEPNPTASFCLCWVAKRPTPGSISVGRTGRKWTARIPAVNGEALCLPPRKVRTLPNRPRAPATHGRHAGFISDRKSVV